MKMALVGAGKIVLSALDALRRLDGIELVALCVREPSRDKGEQLAKQYGIGRVYTDYAALLADSEVEVVYLGVPNHLHFDYAKVALRAGKHVICEKPLTSNLTEARELAALARQQRCMLFEAITSIHTPVFAWLKAHQPELGQQTLMLSNYSQYSSRFDDYQAGKVHAAFDPASSGGALYDINLYNVYLICALLGRPDTVSYQCNKGFNGIDTSGVLTLSYPGQVAVCSGAKDSASPGKTILQGTKGWLCIDDTPNVCGKAYGVLAGQSVQCDVAPEVNHMVYEFAAFRDCLAEQNWPKADAWLDLALLVAEVLEQGRRFAGIVFPADNNTHS